MPVCIAGMHRSGTSMVAHLLHLCGLYLGEEADLLGANAGNPDGHWENQQFLQLNDDILDRLGGAWDLPVSTKEGWQNADLMVPLRARAEDLLRQFRYSEPWGWKDPRNCLTYPFWKALLPDLRVVICLRNPLDVAQSLRERGASSLRFGYELWLRYYRSILDATLPGERIVSHYQSYFHDAQEELRRVLGFVGLCPTDQHVQQVVGVVRQSLQHHVSTTEVLEKAEVPPSVVELYLELEAMAGGVYERLVRERARQSRVPVDRDVEKRPLAVQEGGNAPERAISNAARPQCLPEELPEVSVIIPNFNGCAHLDACLSSLVAMDYPRERLEIIVVDNASTDESVAFVESSFPHVRIIRNNENLGFSRAVNLGAAAANGEYLAFLNNDMRVDREWLVSLVNRAQSEPNVGCVGSTIMDWDGQKLDFAGRHNDLLNLAYSPGQEAVGPEPECPSGGYSLFASGGAMLIRRALFLEMGGFEPEFFMYHEDADLGLRLWLEGYDCVITSESIAYHRGGASSRQLAVDFIDGLLVKHALVTLYKNLDRANLEAFLPLVIHHLLRQSRYWPPRRRAMPLAMQEFIGSLGSIIAKRQAVQRRRRRTDAEVFARAGHPFGLLLSEPSSDVVRRELAGYCTGGAFDAEDEGSAAAAIRAWYIAIQDIFARDLCLEIDGLRAEREATQLLVSRYAMLSGSTVWSLVQCLWRLRLFFIPHGSRRERLLRL